jgi:hypothetical protein
LASIENGIVASLLLADPNAQVRPKSSAPRATAAAAAGGSGAATVLKPRPSSVAVEMAVISWGFPRDERGDPLPADCDEPALCSSFRVKACLRIRNVGIARLRMHAVALDASGALVEFQSVVMHAHNDGQRYLDGRPVQRKSSRNVDDHHPHADPLYTQQPSAKRQRAATRATPSATTTSTTTPMTTQPAYPMQAMRPAPSLVVAGAPPVPFQLRPGGAAMMPIAPLVQHQVPPRLAPAYQSRLLPSPLHQQMAPPHQLFLSPAASYAKPLWHLQPQQQQRQQGPLVLPIFPANVAPPSSSLPLPQDRLAILHQLEQQQQRQLQLRLQQQQQEQQRQRLQFEHQQQQQQQQPVHHHHQQQQQSVQQQQQQQPVQQQHYLQHVQIPR